VHHHRASEEWMLVMSAQPTNKRTVPVVLLEFHQEDKSEQLCVFFTSLCGKEQIGFLHGCCYSEATVCACVLI
jgi:hypothetical protein